MKLFFFTLIAFVLYSKAYCQSLNGVWKGGCDHSILVLNPVEILLEFEVNNDSVISGVIHSYYKKDRFDHTKISGIINWKDSILSIIEEVEISHNINNRLYETCLGTMRLKLSKIGKSYHLNGKWKDQDRKLFHCPTLNTWFEKKILDSLSEPKQGFLSSRSTDILKVIELNSEETDSIKFSIYDNGEIDNDTASVYFNDSLVLKSKRLTLVPIEFFISLDKTKKIHKIKLVAENLGSIPPNTALLIITTRKNRYVVTLSSDYSKNGSVELFLKE